MKTKTILALFIAMFTTTAVVASGGLKVDVVDSEAELTVVEISSVKTSNFEIEVTDSYGDRVYSMKTESPVDLLTKKYDFSLLEDGKYWYSVTTDKEKVLKTLNIEDGEAEVLEIRKAIFPHFQMDNKMLKLSFLNPQKEDVKLYVYDDSNNLLEETSLGTDFTINKAISFNDFAYGEFEVVIANNMDIYEYKVSLD